MDIRKFFTPKVTTKAGAKEESVASHAKNNKLSENKTESPKKTSKSSKKRRIVDSDSDEEPLPKEKKGTSSVARSPKKPNLQKVATVAKTELEKKKPVSVNDFFGSTPVVRGQKLKKLQNEKKKAETEVHEDTDFEETLMKLNTSDLEVKLNTSDLKVKKENVTKDIKKSSAINKSEANPSAKKKPKCSKSPIIEAIPNSISRVSKQVKEEEKPAPKKHKGSANYASYLNREGPRSLGSKEIPEGEEDCLAGLTFIITGVLESFERDEVKDLIQKYGGKVMSTLSKNTKYVVIGRDAGASKLEKAEKFGTKQLDEDGLLELIQTMPGKCDSKPKSRKVENNKSLESTSIISEESAKENNSTQNSTLKNINDSCMGADPSPKKFQSPKKSETIENATVKHSNSPELINMPEEKLANKDIKQRLPAGDLFSLWVDKYKPSSLKQIIGQQGDKSNAKKLLQWLLNWHKNRKLNKKPIPAGRWNASDDGSGFKAALLSGPPGVGKTTTAQLVCKEACFDYFELNASDSRSKKYLQQSVSQLLGNQTLSDCFKDSYERKVSDKHVIVMDEVDGMSGNEDRGGMRELIDFIKVSKVPIICICNDRNHPKIRSLSNYCFDLRFQRPRVEQIKAAMMSVAFKEGIKVSPNVLQDVIVATNQDIRQVLHNMSMWSANAKSLSEEQTKHDVGRGTKHIKMGPFDVLREVFAIGNNPKATIMDKSDLFFHDYSIAPLFVQENYIHVIPKTAEGNKIKHLTLLSEAADSICIGDIIDRQIRNQSSWSLLPVQAIFASVVPGELLTGHLRQMINFPVWLGKNSNRNHMDRVLQELHVHMRMRITGNKTDVCMEYLPLLKHALTKPLIENEQDGIPQALKSMEEYYLLREDFDSIIDLSLWPNQIDPRTKINSKVKSAFTRAYNKEGGKNPYTITNVKKKKKATKDKEDELADENGYVSEEDEEDDKLENDAMIKVKKPAKKATNEENAASTSKEKKKNPSKRGRTK